MHLKLIIADIVSCNKILIYLIIYFLYFLLADKNKRQLNKRKKKTKTFFTLKYLNYLTLDIIFNGCYEIKPIRDDKS